MILRKPKRFLLSPLDQGSIAIVVSKTVGPDLVGQKIAATESLGYETLLLARVRGFLLDWHTTADAYLTFCIPRSAADFLRRSPLF
jgi:hypothetical protein